VLERPAHPVERPADHHIEAPPTLLTPDQSKNFAKPASTASPSASDPSCDS
jgi:hypothetical protein